jgi:3-oxoacyl-[acyl-carrier-protein] synthase II
MNGVVVTGVGVVSPIGNCFGEFLNALEKGISATNNIIGFNIEHMPCALGAEVKDEAGVIKRNSSMDKKEIFLKKAMDELLNGNIDFEKHQPQNRILNLGAGLDYFDLQNYIDSRACNEGRWLDYSYNTNKMVGKLATQYNIKGGHTLNVSACVASSQSIGLSYRTLKNSKRKDIIISGGFDSMLNPLHFMGFYKLGAFSNWQGNPQNACRPFDKDRTGIVLGEGAAVFAMQNDQYADKSKILAEIVGYASTMDSYSITDPDPTGNMLAVAAIRAISEANISVDEIDCVHMHGTGTIKNDFAETRAMESIFGKRYTTIPVFSMKGQIGHLIAACGAVEFAGVIYSLVKQRIPPTNNCVTNDPEIKLRVIKDEPLEMKINYILKLNSAFGGQNTAIVVKKYGT